MDEDALLAQALWAAEQAELYEMAYGETDRAADTDSDYERSSSKRRKQQNKKGKQPPRPRNNRKSSAAAASTHNNNNAAAAPDSNGTLAAEAAVGSTAAAVDTTAAAAAMGPAGASGNGPVAAADAAAAAGVETFGAGGRRKRKDSGQKRERGKSWSDVEEASFLSGLEAHGRDWKAIAADIGTRDARAVASHAQKHFIRLCMSGTPLPARVLESGAGYTLSGKLLDPHSAAAAAYGFSYDLLLERLDGEQLATALSGLMPLEGQQQDVSAAAAADSGSGQDLGPARDQQVAAAGAAAAAGPAPKRQRRAASNSSRGSSGKEATDLPAVQQQQQGCDVDKVAAILAAAAPPPLAASEAAALAAAAAAAATTPGNAAAGDATVVAAAASGAAPDDVAAAAAAPNTTADDSSEQQQRRQGEPTTNPATTAADAASASAVACGGETATAVQLNTAVMPGAAAAAAAATEAAAADGLTEYARSRPRRARAAAAAVSAQLGDTSESLELVAPVDFIGPEGSGVGGAQPYKVEVDLQSMLLMEVHCHLSGCEVIGLLGGTWDSNRRLLRVRQAYPCRRAAGSVTSTSVELDASSEVEARGEMNAAGQRCVGWYHSHPVFEPCPSRKDMDNQRNYQALTRDSSGSNGSSGGCDHSCGVGAAPPPTSSSGGSSSSVQSLEPFVGFILSPYDPALPLPHSAVKAFVVQQRGSQGDTLLPYNIRYGLVNSSSVPGPPFHDRVQQLLISCKHDLARTDFAAPWRPFSVLAAGPGRLLGPPLTKLDKLLAGLRWQCGHVVDKGAVEDWLAGLCKAVQEVWEVQLIAPTRAKSLTCCGASKKGPQQQQPDEKVPQQLSEQQQQQCGEDPGTSGGWQA